MESAFKIWQKNRSIYLDYITTKNLEQLNKIPDGFSNNIIWNIGHIVMVQQSMVYKAAGLPMYISDDFFKTYKPGSKPTELTTLTEVEELKKLLITTIEQTKLDFNLKKFTTFYEFTTRTGFHIGSTMEAIDFNNFHEGIHLGCIMNISKFV